MQKTIDQIVPAASNPRRSFISAADDELLESIRQHGILTPILVRPLNDAGAGLDGTYEIVAGHRRYAAARELGFSSVPVTILELDDDAAREVAIIENLQREDLAPLDEAESYAQLLRRPGETPATVAAKVGKSPPYIGRRLRLLDCCLEVREALREGRLDVARAELLAKLAPETQEKALDECVWSPFFTDPTAPDTANQPAGRLQTAANLSPLAELRDWVNEHTTLKLADLVHDQATRELFPEAAEAMDAARGDAVDDPTGQPCSSAGVPLLAEIALNRFQQSPAKDSIPEGVLVMGKHFRQVTGKPCKSAEKAVVVFGQCRGDVVTVCRAKKSCTTHWPPPEKKNPAPATSGAARHQTWQEQEEGRTRERAIFERVKPALVKAIVAATAKVQTTPKILQAVLENSHFDQVKPVLNVIGKLTPATFGRAWTLADALGGLYNAPNAADVIKDLGLKFDLAKAMRDAEATMQAETDAKVQAAVLAKQKADQARAKAPINRVPLTNVKSVAQKKPAAKTPAPKPSPARLKKGRAA